MASLPEQQVEVRVVCNGQELKVRGSKFLNEPPNARIKSSESLEKTIETFVTQYSGTTNQFSIVHCYGSVCTPPDLWIVTPRRDKLLASTNIKGRSKSTDTSYLDAILREFEEESGSTIDPSLFHEETPTKFCLNVDASAKAVLDANFQSVKPATEIYEWIWVSPSSSQAGLPCPGTVVKASDVKQTAVTQAVIKAKTSFNSAKQSTQVGTSRKTTIHRKKSKRSKKRGTLKRGGRR